MKLLSELIEEIDMIELVGNDQVKVENIAIDSRSVKKDGLFVAIEGTSQDGHKFIENAVQNGARVIVCRYLPDTRSPEITMVRVADPADAAGRIAHAFYDKPSQHLALIGVTGTNGKTTVATLLYRLLGRLGQSAGLVSTIECRIATEVLPATHTTPDPVTLNRMLKLMVDAGCRYCSMEVSSHALDQKRTSGLVFRGGIFTNLSHDHLDYHGSFEHYLNAKKSFFDGLGAQAFALVNADDPRGSVMVQNTLAKVSKYSMHTLAGFKAKILSNHIEGLHIRIDDVEMLSKLVGAFNAYNLLAVYGAAVLLGFDKQDVITALSGLDPVDGRFDITRQPDSGISAIVDYAHTPDALQKVLSTLQQLKTPGTRIIAVVGCGGDRDRQKRPRMGRIAASLADIVILTSDNPRTEDPVKIIDEMMEGVNDEESKKVLKIADRKEAIRTATRLAHRGDIILIAGKGHETYQEIHGKRFPFNDKEIVHEALFEDI